MNDKKEWFYIAAIALLLVAVAALKVNLNAETANTNQLALSNDNAMRELQNRIGAAEYDLWVIKTHFKGEINFSLETVQGVGGKVVCQFGADDCWYGSYGDENDCGIRTMSGINGVDVTKSPMGSEQCEIIKRDCTLNNNCHYSSWENKYVLTLVRNDKSGENDESGKVYYVNHYVN